jgi:hypothetical protein
VIPAPDPKTTQTWHRQPVCQWKRACPPLNPAHSMSKMPTAASPVFTELIAASDVIIGETAMAKGLEP